jgi:hypothetical protein
MDIDYTAPLPAVAAEYRTERQAGGDMPPVVGSWLLWREPDRVQRDFPASRTTEIWRRDGGALFHVKYFHDAHRGIEFQQPDLTMLGALPTWQQLGLTVAPELLADLQPVASGSDQGHAWRRYRGSHNGVQWDITIRTDLMLPERVERVQGAHREQITLQGAWSLAEAPWKPVSVDSYDVLDFSDLGDHEHDPFVVAVQGQLGIAHGREH